VLLLFLLFSILLFILILLLSEEPRLDREYQRSDPGD
jgi:hypothetical protein